MERYGENWRCRIERIRIYLYDQFDEIIPNGDGDFSIMITYPMIFNDLDENKNQVVFSAKRHKCRFAKNIKIASDILVQLTIISDQHILTMEKNF